MTELLAREMVAIAQYHGTPFQKPLRLRIGSPAVTTTCKDRSRVDRVRFESEHLTRHVSDRRRGDRREVQQATRTGAHDVDRAAMRTFVLTRLREPVLSNDRFEKPKDFNADEYLRGSFGVYKGNEDFEVVIEFDLWASDLLRGRKWHPSQDFIALPNGCSHVSFRLSSLDEIERWILNWGTHATVVRPEQLRERVGATARAVAEKYEGDSYKN